MATAQCPKCGGPMEDGAFGSTGGVQTFRSNRQGPRDMYTQVRPARACLHCGYLELYVDPQELNERLNPKAGRG